MLLETLRLINPLITTFRSLSQDFKFDEKYFFKKGTQFLILNNPVLREKEYYEDPDKFIPDRWTHEMEKSYYAISFGQGPQKCPGKELVIYLAQSFLYNFITKVLNAKKEDKNCRTIEALRKELCISKQIIQITDFGAGSSINNSKKGG